MVDSKGIYRYANNIVEKYGTRDTLLLAKNLGIEVISVDYFKSLLGMYTYKWRTRAIFLNNRMDEYLTQMVCAHEIGHDIYHRELAKNEGLKEFELFRMDNSTEYEANAFASHILINTEECLELARNGYDVVQMAKIMNSEINLLLIKLQEMAKLGYELRVPITPQGNFFKNIKA